MRNSLLLVFEGSNELSVRNDTLEQRIKIFLDNKVFTGKHDDSGIRIVFDVLYLVRIQIIHLAVKLGHFNHGSSTHQLI